MRSFRSEIARRMALVVGALLATFATFSIWSLSRLLENDLDATLLRIAEVEAEAGTTGAVPEFRFHESILVNRTDPGLPELTRYAQLLARDGSVRLRSRNLAQELPVPAEALDAARQGVVTWTTHTGRGGERLRSLLYPLQRIGNGQNDNILQVAAPFQPVIETTRSFAWFLGLVTLGTTMVAFLMGWRGAGVAVRPIQEMARQAEGLEISSLSARITADHEVAEFRQLAKVLNAMLERLEKSFDSQRRFTADASHELRRPLNVLRGEIEVAMKRPRSEVEYRTVLERCRDEVLRLSGLTNDLLILARADAGGLTPRHEPVNLIDVAEGVVQRYRPVAVERQVELELLGSGGVWLPGDADLLDRATANLVDNALRFTRPGGRITVEVAGGSPVTLTVRDTGSGVAPHHVPHLFERFFQADPARPRIRGSAGLGLAIARAAIEVHGGTLTFEGNEPGAVFRMAIPVPATMAEPVVTVGTDG